MYLKILLYTYGNHRIGLLVLEVYKQDFWLLIFVDWIIIT